MAKQLFTNRASSLLAGTILDSALTLTVTVGDGDLFPILSGTDYAMLTLEDATGGTEVVKATDRAFGSDSFTIVRGQDGTLAAGWTQNITRVELRATAAAMNVFVQRDGDNMTGPLAMDGFGITDPVVTGAAARWEGGEIVATPIRGVSGDASNEIDVPAAGARPTIGGVDIALVSELDILVPVGTIVMWGLAIGAHPDATRWKICDGAPPAPGDAQTPDLRDRFIVASGPGRPQDSTTIPGATGVSGAGTAHTHTGNPTVLLLSDIPAHKHISGVSVRARAGTWSGTDSQGQYAPYNGVLGPPPGAGGVDWIWENAQQRSNSTIGQPYTETVGGGASHLHTNVNESSHTHITPLVQPSSYSLIFLMKVAA